MIVGLSGCSCPPEDASLKGKSPPVFNHFHFRAPLILFWNFNGNGILYTQQLSETLSQKCAHVSILGLGLSLNRAQDFERWPR